MRTIRAIGDSVRSRVSIAGEPICVSTSFYTYAVIAHSWLWKELEAIFEASALRVPDRVNFALSGTWADVF